MEYEELCDRPCADNPFCLKSAGCGGDNAFPLRHSAETKQCKKQKENAYAPAADQAQTGETAFPANGFAGSRFVYGLVSFPEFQGALMISLFVFSNPGIPVTRGDRDFFETDIWK